MDINLEQVNYLLSCDNVEEIHDRLKDWFISPPFEYSKFGFPKIVEISKDAIPFKISTKDPNFDKKLSELEKNYKQ